jgi:Lipocalin-like domain
MRLYCISCATNKQSTGKNQLMKIIISSLFIASLLISCETTPKEEDMSKTLLPVEGTWKLLSGTTIEKGDTTVTDYTQGRSFIKIINDSHFAFAGHDLNKGKDSTAFFSSGSGTYELKDSAYTEHLEYCNDRAWEGNDFHFTVTISNDTLIQQGIEKIESAGVNRINIEKYIRFK